MTTTNNPPPDSSVTYPPVHHDSSKGISLFWLVPLLAMGVAGLVVWKSLSERGPLIEVLFSTGHGFVAGKTEIRHKDIVVGLVEEVTLTDNLKAVKIKARMNKVVAPYLGDTSLFWAVTARISGSNLSGLGTLLSGNYIELAWTAESTSKTKTFTGLDEPPKTPVGTPGRHLRLSSFYEDSIKIGAAIYYRSVKVGQIESRRLADDYSRIEYRAFIRAPFDKLINSTTRFWEASALNIDLHDGGLKVRMASLDAVLNGGVTFANLGRKDTAVAVPVDSSFEIFPDRENAVENQFNQIEYRGLNFIAEFDTSVRGLQKGASVEWRGVRIGTVRDVVAELASGDKIGQQMYAVMELQPQRVGFDDGTPEELREELHAWLDSGVRVQIATTSLLSDKKLLRLVSTEGSDGLQVDYAAQPYPSIPTIPSDINAMTLNVEKILDQLANLPLDKLIRSGIQLLDNTGTLIDESSLDATLQALAKTLTNVQAASNDLPRLVSNLNQVATIGETTLSGLSADSALYVDLSGAVRDFRSAARSLASLAEMLEDNPNALIIGR